MSQIYRREIVIATFGVLVAGCAEGPANEDEEPLAIAEQFDCAVAQRPEPGVEVGVEVEVEGDDGETVTFKSIGSTTYPEPPEHQDEDAVEDFLKEHEIAYRQNELADIYEEELIDFGLEFDEVHDIGQRGGIHQIGLAYDEAFETVDQAGHGPRNVAYAIDGSGLVRLDRVTFDQLDDTTILKDGDLITCF